MCFFFNDTATTEIYTLSLHDALPISDPEEGRAGEVGRNDEDVQEIDRARHASAVAEVGAHSTTYASIAKYSASPRDRKSTRLNSSHANISYAVFCLKKKKQIRYTVIS